MSEFQYYEFYSIDRELTHKEREEIDDLSSRFSPTSRRAVFSYSYSSFRHSEEAILLKYFDFFLYLSNWGTKRIMYKFPEGLVDFREIKQYICNFQGYFDNGVRIYKKSKFIFIDINFSEEEGDYWIEDEGYISSDLIGLRNDILGGDYRALFIMWLHIKKMEFDSEQINESMVIPKKIIPDDLENLNSNLESLITLYEIDTDWIKGSSNYSHSSNTKARDYEELLGKLSPDKKNNYLIKVLSGELNLKIKLQRELEKLGGIGERKEKGKITFKELLESVKNEKIKRVKLEENEAKRAIRRKLKEIEKNKEIILKEIDYHIEKGSGKSYDEALKRILNIRDLSLYKKEEEKFKKWIKKIKKKVVVKPAMLKRIENEGL